MLERTLTGLADAQAELGAATLQRVEAVEAVLAQVNAAIEALSRQLVTVSASVQGTIEDATTRASERFSQDLGTLGEQLGSDLSAAADSARQGVREAMVNVDVHMAATRDRLASAPTRKDLDALSASLQEAADGASAVATNAVERLEGILSRAEQTLTETDLETKALVERITQSLQTLDGGFARIDRLASAIESLGRKRGFQELVAGEQRLREEQAQFVRDLAGTGERIAERIQGLDLRIAELEGRLDAATGAATALRSLPENISGTISSRIEGLRERMEKALEARFAQDVQSSTKRLRAELEQGVPVSETLRELRALTASQYELARAQERSEHAAARLTEELTALRARIDGWGRLGSAPRLAEQVKDLEERVGELEGRLEDSLPGEIAKRVAAEVMQLQGAKRRGIRRR
jgi:uncharacterized phage infection (PIP) family protein YhgE